MDIRLDQTTLETCPFGELRHGAAAFEAVVAHGRADGGGEIPVAATCVHVDEALSQRLGQSARSLAFAWVSPEGHIPATHIWPLRPTTAFQQWARAGHTFALLDMEQVGETGGADIPTGALPATAVLASFTPMRKNGDAPVLLSVSMTTPAVAALAGLRGGEGVHVSSQHSPREGAMGALSWLFDDEMGALCDASILSKYVANAARNPQRRTINCANATFRRAVAPSPAAGALLYALGFRPSSAGLTVATVDAALFDEVAALLRAPPVEPPWAACRAGDNQGGVGTRSRWDGPSQRRNNWNGGRRGGAPPPPPPGANASSWI